MAQQVAVLAASRHGGYGYITQHMGQSDKWRHEPLGTEFDPMQMFASADLGIPSTADTMTIEILSDDAREPIISPALERRARFADLLGTAVASLIDPDTIDAEATASRIMTASRIAGLDDNATVAFAHVAVAADSGNETDD